MTKKQVFRYVLGGAIICGAGSVMAEGSDVISSMAASATSLITSAVTAVSALCIAGFAIAGAMWGARKIKSGIKSA